MGHGDGHKLAQLEAEYCPPLDSALFAAIISDFDLGDTERVKEARVILDELKETALVEEATAFDPSGTTAHDEHGLNDEVEPGHRSESGSEAVKSRSHDTDMTSLSNGLSSLDFNRDEYESEVPPDLAEDLESLDLETKLSLLDEVLGHQISKYTIKHTLNKCQGNWHKAMEELLNHVYFNSPLNDENEPPVTTKGIDAFFDDEQKGKAKKAKTKPSKRRNLATTPLQEHDQVGTTKRNIWNNAPQDIDFLASRTRIATSTVSSAYHANNASVSKTLGALLKASMEESKHLVSDEATVSAAAQELHEDFPTISSDYILTIIRLTYPSTSTAHELAQALVTKPQAAGGLQVIPQYAPISDLLVADKSFSHRPVASSSSTVLPSHIPDDPLSRASHYASLRNTAYAQASAAHRRARSDKAMSGVAAYYSDQARLHSSSLHQNSSAYYDQLVSSQSSSSSSIDLHGVDVQNAIRISLLRVRNWYSSQTELRSLGRQGSAIRQQGFEIIVGKGIHSEGGKGKLGPAVRKALKEDGWKAEILGPVVHVSGRER